MPRNWRVITAKEFTLEQAVYEYRRLRAPKSQPAWGLDWVGRDAEWEQHLASLKDNSVLEKLIDLTAKQDEPEEFIKVWPEVPMLTCCGNRVDKVVVFNEELIEDYYDVSQKFCVKCATELLNLLK